MTPLPAPLVIASVFAYIFLLFWVAKKGDQEQFVANSWTRHPMIYALALGVYCTSWTFFGLVGTAAESGWDFFPVLLGPMLLFTVGFPVLKRIYQVCQQEHIHSLADFLASRYGKRQGVAATVTVVLFLVTIPYIALQLKAVSDALLLLLGEDFLLAEDLVMITAVSMTLFALSFGARRLDMSGFHSGLMSVLAFESVIKILVLLMIALFSLALFADMSVPVNEIQQLEKESNGYLLETPVWSRFIIGTFLSMCAILCLPRMFHVTFVECVNEQSLKKSRWIFPLYLFFVSLFVLMIAWVGNVFFNSNTAVAADSYIIALPLSQGSGFFTLLAFLGGFSASTAMIMVATITLGQMLSNDVILPLLLKANKRKKLKAGAQGKTKETGQQDFYRTLIFFRRITVTAVVVAAYLYQVLLIGNAALSSVGLIVFALSVQLFPAIIFGLYWRKGNVKGLYIGLAGGLLCWFYLFMLPLMVDAGLLAENFFLSSFYFDEWVRSDSLFGIFLGDSFSRNVVISLSVNVLLYIWYSLNARESLLDRMQSAAFTRFKKGSIDFYEEVDVDDLKVMLHEFLGNKSIESLFAEYEQNGDKHKLVEDAQKRLGSIVGVASSQAMVDSLRIGKEIAVEDVFGLMEETTKALRFNQELLFSSFESISSGISVVDSDLKLVAWNRRYQDIFAYPEGKLEVGIHIAEIMRYNGERGLIDGDNLEQEIRKRLHNMSTGKPYRFIRTHRDDLIIEIKGNPLPNGGYVTAYDDITEFFQAQKELEEANERLEERVSERTREAELAKKTAEQANLSKTRFLALAGHDIMQPLNAANLYLSVLKNSNNLEVTEKDIVSRLDDAVQNTESIISALIEIAKIDNNTISPNLSVFALDEILSSLVEEANLLVEKNISIRYVPSALWVESDKHYLRRVVQNFISNAVKYTPSGKVLIGCRRRSDNEHQKLVEIMVLDTGPGISEADQKLIFQDFYRVNDPEGLPNVEGLGLGLSVVARFSEIMGHPIRCQSQPGVGSVFSVKVPLAEARVVPFSSSRAAKKDKPQTGQQYANLSVACLDDDPQNLVALTALLSQWGCEVNTFDRIKPFSDFVSENRNNIDLLVMDYQLGVVGVSGVDVAESLTAGEAYSPTVCIVSASREKDLPQKVTALGFHFLPKPLKPARLNALLGSVQATKPGLSKAP